MPCIEREKSRCIKKRKKRPTQSHISSYSMSNYMILIFQDFFKGSIQDLYTIFLDSLNLFSLTCPHCRHRGNFVFNGTYLRYCISIGHGTITETAMALQRVKCKQCGHTHALLPNLMVPYHTYSYAFIIAVLASYYLEHKSIDEICHQYDISHPLLYTWKKRFQKHKVLSALVQQLQDKKSTIILEEIQRVTIPVFLKSFFIEHQLPFLHTIDSYVTTSVGIE